MQLMPHQLEALEQTKNLNHVAYFYDMGLGKTFIGAEKMHRLNAQRNLLICQKSKINDWIEHFRTYYKYNVFDLTSKKQLDAFLCWQSPCVAVINYELAWRRKELLELSDYTLMLDESSLIQNDKAKQTKFVLKLASANVILLSGTPVSGKYENLWTQAHLLGWNISRDLYDKTYINYILTPDDGSGLRHRIVDKREPYRNVERLKYKLREHGAVFKKTEEVLKLPEQIFTPIYVKKTQQYSYFLEHEYIVIDEKELIGATPLTKRLYLRALASVYSNYKLQALTDFIQSTNDRIIIFYNFNDELEKLKAVAGERPVSIVNGQTKDLTAYENEDNSITLVQYQAGAMGLNLQKCNKIFYFSLPERSDLFEQSKKRIHRIGTQSTCFYYVALTTGSIDMNIYEALKHKKDYTDELFKKDINDGRL